MAVFLNIIIIYCVYLTTSQYTQIWYNDMTSSNGWTASGVVDFGYESSNSCFSGQCTRTTHDANEDAWIRRETDVSSYSSLRLEYDASCRALEGSDSCNVYYSYSGSSLSDRTLLKVHIQSEDVATRDHFPDQILYLPDASSKNTIWIWLESCCEGSGTDYCFWDEVYLKGVLKQATSAPTPATSAPTPAPTAAPTSAPTPTKKPSKHPTKRPTQKPTNRPTKRPTNKPTNIPTQQPTNPPIAQKMTDAPAQKPSIKTTIQPSHTPTMRPILYISLPTIPAILPESTYIESQSSTNAEEISTVYVVTIEVCPTNDIIDGCDFDCDAIINGVQYALSDAHVTILKIKCDDGNAVILEVSVDTEPDEVILPYVIEYYIEAKLKPIYPELEVEVMRKSNVIQDNTSKDKRFFNLTIEWQITLAILCVVSICCCIVCLCLFARRRKHYRKSVAEVVHLSQLQKRNQAIVNVNHMPSTNDTDISNALHMMAKGRKLPAAGTTMKMTMSVSSMKGATTTGAILHVPDPPQGEIGGYSLTDNSANVLQVEDEDVFEDSSSESDLEDMWNVNHNNADQTQTNNNTINAAAAADGNQLNQFDQRMPRQSSVNDDFQTYGFIDWKNRNECYNNNNSNNMM